MILQQEGWGPDSRKDFLPVNSSSDALTLSLGSSEERREQGSWRTPQGLGTEMASVGGPRKRRPGREDLAVLSILPWQHLQPHYIKTKQNNNRKKPSFLI